MSVDNHLGTQRLIMSLFESPFLGFSRPLAHNLNRELDAEQIFVQVISQLPFHNQPDCWVLALDRQLVDVAVNIFFLNRALDSTLATIFNWDWERNGHFSNHSMYDSFTGLTRNITAEGYIDSVVLSLVKLAWLLWAGLDVNPNNCTLY